MFCSLPTSFPVLTLMLIPVLMLQCCTNGDVGSNGDVLAILIVADLDAVRLSTFSFVDIISIADVEAPSSDFIVFDGFDAAIYFVVVVVLVVYSAMHFFKVVVTPVVFLSPLKEARLSTSHTLADVSVVFLDMVVGCSYRILL